MAPEPTSLDPTLTAAVTAFISAFSAMDEERFDAMWSDDATVFMPFHIDGHGGGRLAGKRAVLDAFHALFTASRMRGPSLEIQPQDVAIQACGGVAIVTFHLRNATARRTVVFCQCEGGWRIVHLHASPMLPPVTANPVPSNP